ncbi:Hint domain-containing protein [Paracoccus limosus]|uniref:Hint domain-containing protein n=1 Tax=Paracoccus limosus TaxID=913252 RepID=UPI001FE5F62D|nr:Hint domain-containing protein [Paracoccus limosus]
MATYTYPGSPTTLTLTGRQADTIVGNGIRADSSVTVSVSGGGKTLTMNDAFVTLDETGGNGRFILNNSALVIGEDAKPRYVDFGTGNSTVQLPESAYTQHGMDNTSFSGFKAGDGIFAPDGYVLSNIVYSPKNNSLVITMTPEGGGASHDVHFGSVSDADGHDYPAGFFQITADGTAIAHGPIVGPVICFARGTLIQTPDGPRAIEDLHPGDLVLTLDHGAQPLRWIGAIRVGATWLALAPRLRPIRIRAGALGAGLPATDLVVSPQHRVLVRSAIAQRMFGATEVLVAAKQLVQIDGIDIATDLPEVEYFHLLFDRHEVVIANGAPTETLFTGPRGAEGCQPRRARGNPDAVPGTGLARAYTGLGAAAALGAHGAQAGLAAFEKASAAGRCPAE